jgi:hypothetical protein
MRSPKTIGLDDPGPGSLTFQRRFSESLHVNGRFVSELTPSAFEPRNWAQSPAVVIEFASERTATTSNVRKKKFVSINVTRRCDSAGLTKQQTHKDVPSPDQPHSRQEGFASSIPLLETDRFAWWQTDSPRYGRDDLLHARAWQKIADQVTDFLRRLTVMHTMRHHAHYETNRTGQPFYQGRFKSLPTQSDKHLLITMRYVERNPVRAKFVNLSEEC